MRKLVLKLACGLKQVVWLFGFDRLKVYQLACLCSWLFDRLQAESWKAWGLWFCRWRLVFMQVKASRFVACCLEACVMLQFEGYIVWNRFGFKFVLEAGSCLCFITVCSFRLLVWDYRLRACVYSAPSLLFYYIFFYISFSACLLYCKPLLSLSFLSIKAYYIALK